MAGGRAPDYKLTALDKDSNDRNYHVGVAWKQQNGSIRIKLNPCTKLEYDPGMVISLWPSDATPSKGKKAVEEAYDEEDTPF